MVSTLHRCSYVNLTISSVNKLKTIWRFSPFFPSFTFLFSLFSLFCFSSLCQRVVLLNLLDIKVNPNSLERERERWRERESRRSQVVRGWSGGAMMLGKLLVPGHSTNLDNSRARAYCACSRCGWGLFGHFFSSSFFHFFLPLWETARYRLKYCFKGPLNPK